MPQPPPHPLPQAPPLPQNFSYARRSRTLPQSPCAGHATLPQPARRLPQQSRAPQTRLLPQITARIPCPSQPGRIFSSQSPATCPARSASSDAEQFPVIIPGGKSRPHVPVNITVNSQTVADVEIQGVTLRRALGAYDLVFGLYLTTKATPELARRVSIAGAQVSIKTGPNERHLVGFARPETPLVFTTGTYEAPVGSALMLPLQPGQVAAIEQLRGAGDLEFELLVRGIGRIQEDEQAIHETWNRRVPRSEWLERLRAAGARNVLLLEVPLPVRKTSAPWAKIARDLQRAEECLRNGDYHGCVSTCRLVVQSLGQHKFKRSKWAGSLLKRLSDNGSNMSKHERESALWACLRHYTHQAHHTEDEGGEAGYSRADAMLILTLTASFVAHAQSG